MVIGHMVVYHFVDPDLRVEIFFEIEESTKNGSLDFEIGDTDFHFHSPHRHLDISQAITAGSSLLHIASRQTQTGNLWFPSPSCKPLSYALFLDMCCVPVIIEVF